MSRVRIFRIYLLSMIMFSLCRDIFIQASEEDHAVLGTGALLIQAVVNEELVAHVHGDGAAGEVEVQGLDGVDIDGVGAAGGAVLGGGGDGGDAGAHMLKADLLGQDGAVGLDGAADDLQNVGVRGGPDQILRQGGGLSGGVAEAAREDDGEVGDVVALHGGIFAAVLVADIQLPLGVGLRDGDDAGGADAVDGGGDGGGTHLIGVEILAVEAGDLGIGGRPGGGVGVAVDAQGENVYDLKLGGGMEGDGDLADIQPEALHLCLGSDAHQAGDGVASTGGGDQGGAAGAGGDDAVFVDSGHGLVGAGPGHSGGGAGVIHHGDLGGLADVQQDGVLGDGQTLGGGGGDQVGGGVVGAVVAHQVDVLAVEIRHIKAEGLALGAVGGQILAGVHIAVDGVAVDQHAHGGHIHHGIAIDEGAFQIGAAVLGDEADGYIRL